MKLLFKKILIVASLLSASASAFAQVDIKVVQQGNFVSLDTLHLTIDPNDTTGRNGVGQYTYFRVYNLSATNSAAFYLKAEWLCSNSSAFYQFCQEYPPDYMSGNCHTYHKEGERDYDQYNYLIPPDTCDYNYLKCYFKIYDYSVEQEHEKVCRFSIIKKNTGEVLDVMYMIISRGNLPCNVSQPVDTGNTTGIALSSVDNMAEIYPNPAHDFIMITAKQNNLSSWSLHSLDGRRVLHGAKENSDMFSINVGGVSKGVYYLRLTDTKNAAYYKKIVIDN